MRFHITATHTTENCVVFDKELGATVFAWAQTVPELLEKSQVKMQSMLVDAPGHTTYIVCDAPDAGAVTRLS